jgi:molybdopterin converting factor small subunit
MMEPDQIIERIGSDNPPTIDELNAAHTELTDAQATLRAEIVANATSTDYAAVSALKADFDAVTDALTKVTDALSSAQAEIDAIIAEVGGSEDAGDGEEAAAETDENAAAEPVAASIRARSALARVRDRAPVVTNERDLTDVRSHFTLMGKDRERVTAADVGEAFEIATRQFGGSKTNVLSIKHELNPDRVLSGDASANERKLLDLFGANPILPVTAAGGCCSIPEPIYDQPLVGDLSRPIAASMDTLGASRGAVQAYPPVCIPDSGADVWTCVQDAAVDPEDPETWKSCVAVECEDSEPTLVEPIFMCLTVGTFQQRFAREQWEAYIFQTKKLAARKAESRLFGWLQDAATTNVTGFSTGSTYANLIKSLSRMAAGMRQDERLGDAQMVAYGPSWIYNAIVEDTLQRRLNDADEVEFVRSRVDAILANEGIRYVGSDDVALLNSSAYADTMPDYPATAPVVLLPAGVTKRLDGGEENLGIDIQGMNEARQNIVGAFDEFWEGLLVRNCAVAALDIPIEECDLICPGE